LGYRRRKAVQEAAMAEHHEKTEATPGTMDLTHHRKTFAGFIRLTMWVIAASLGSLIFLALVNV
jgi:hypothetical protein